MKVREIMTENPLFCTPETGLLAAAKIMQVGDCGELPVLGDARRRRPVGVITDRDIVCRALAAGENPLALTVKDCMSAPAVTVRPETDVDVCCELLETLKIRRVPVVDEEGRCCGIVAQADIALKCAPGKAEEVVREVSQA